MISKHFCAIERGGLLWDAGSILFEFDALREPEKTQFPRIRPYLESLNIQFNEVTPQMLWGGKLWPDLFIANQLDVLKANNLTAPDPCWDWNTDGKELEKKLRENDWDDTTTLYVVSAFTQGEWLHENFIETMCKKIAGIPTQEVIAKYHRSLWLPLYWPETLRERKSLDTRFWYPTSGYAGIVYQRHNEGSIDNPRNAISATQCDSVELTLTFILAKPARPFQALFVVDKSPIYRVTNQDACAGLTPQYHRFVIESREYCQDIGDEMKRLNLLCDVQYSSQLKIKMPLPTLANYRRGWRPAPHLNAQLLEIMNATARA